MARVRVSMWILLLLLAAAARGQTLAPGEVPLTDLLEVIVLEGEVLAVDASGGGQVSVSLHLKEEVLWTGSRGRLGLVLTDERLLAVSAGAPSWQELRWERIETRPSGALLGDRVGLIVTTHRAIGFETGSGRLVEYRLGTRERLVATRTGENVVVVVTNRKALGLSPSGGFSEIGLQLRERVHEVSARSNVATVRTDRRLLIFRGPTRSWSEERLELRQSGG